MYGESVITALTAQNTLGVKAVEDASPTFIADQLDCVFSDIYPDAVKIGMVSVAATIEVIAEKLVSYRAQRVVVDPVMVSTSGSRLLSNGAEDALVGKLLPLGDIVTPNIPEASQLTGVSIESKDDMVVAAEAISRLTPGAVLVKGGHFEDRADDLLKVGDRLVWLLGDHIDNENTHGTGCTLSSAIACNLASGDDMEQAVRRAKTYLSGALRANLDLGHGRGPINHLWAMGGAGI